MDHEAETLLRTAADDVAVGSPPVDDLVARARRRVRRRRTLGAAGAAVAVAAVAAVVPVTRALQDEPGPVASAPTCQAVVPQRVLPTWARDGFSGDEPRASYVTGEHGRIIAVVFGPLSSPAARDRANKVLWVEGPRTTSEPDAGEADPDLRVVATLGGTRVVRTLHDAPGPSTLDLPRAGCWHLTLTWSGRTDRMDLRYARPG